ncbi:MAG: hypothetical protein DMG38_06760 [Acidobacteria bacterium]|nr:MAG: hypothetical protein DMG38_06760 [Acidobacteriota bacterium]
MKQKKERLAGMHAKKTAAAAAMTLLVAAGAAALPGKGTTPERENKEKQMTTTQSKFYCNIKALTPEERSHHNRLSDKLMTARSETIEMEKGYEFQFSPQNVTLAELADWVAGESKCCPFFDFHIDLENEGKLLCLRLTGEEGIKQFIRAEFPIQ